MNPEDRNQPDDFESRTRAMFDASIERLDGRTRSKLTQARHAAVEELRQQRRRPWRRAWVPLSGITAAAVLAIWMTVGPIGRGTPGAEVPEVSLDEFELVAESPSIDLLEDVEFYAWIAQQSARPENSSG
jgi:hypothetical protein